VAPFTPNTDSPGDAGTPRVQTMSAPLVPERVELTIPRSRVVPVAQQRVSLTLTMSQEANEKLQHAANLLSHRLPSGDLAQVIEHLLDLVIPVLEKRKFAVTDKPRPSRRKAPRSRRVPSEVRREVWKRDGGQCTFRSESGQRCAARKFLEFDHIEPVARGGTSTVANLRLRCRAHNQYEAERAFGASFMKAKREETAERRRQAAAREQPEEVISALHRARAGTR
jgi:hypothetical protein